MQSRFTVKGVTNDEKDVVLAYELKEEEFKVDLYIVPKKSLKGEALEKLEKNWVDGEAYDFPKGTELITPNLDADTILPDNIRSDESGKIRIRQNDWAYQLITAKLWEDYLNKLGDLKKRAAEMTQYDRQLFEDAKSFWEKVLEHRKERDLNLERLDKIKVEVNAIFEVLKNFRKTESAEYESASAKMRDEVVAKLEVLRKRAEAKENFKLLGDEFKNVQTESRKNRYTRADEQLIRKACDSTLQFINEQRNNFYSDKTATRTKGLTEAIERVQQSLDRDKKDLEYLARKSNSKNASSLELQLIKVKTNMLNETIASKEAKLKDIHATLDEVLQQAKKTNKHTEHKGKVKDEITVTEKKSAEEVVHPVEPNTSKGEEPA